MENATNNTLCLSKLKVGQTAKITKVGSTGSLRQHFLDMGLIPGVEVTLQQLAPMGDPMELKIHDYELTLRLSDADKIEISEPYILEKTENINTNINTKSNKLNHPGIGEGGKYHNHNTTSPFDKNHTLKFALVGNQNCGKTTLFNQLTGSNQHVGNFPGVTVDRKDGKIRGHNNTIVTDLPGIYSLSPYSDEELVSRDFILKEKPEGIINIIDATNIERNLYLTLQLMELNVPMTLALNMMDEVTNNGGFIDINKMEELLGIPVIPISAKKNEGVDELIKHSVHIAYYQEKPTVFDFCDENTNGAVHRAIHGIMYLIEDHAKKAQIPLRFAATKIIEGDKLVIDSLGLTTNEQEMIEHIVVQMENESGLDRSAAIADMRYSFIQKVCKQCVNKPHESKEHIRSRKIDKVLTGKYTSIPIFILILGLVFFLTFNVIGSGLQKLLDLGITSLTGLLDQAFVSMKVHPVLHSLVINGIFEGIGSVISFMPIIVVLFFFLSFLEDSGYMARIAFVMDKLLRKIGLSGKSIVPMLMGFGCTVPGVMSTRTLSSERDRKLTIMLTPFMSCSAKLPIYSFISLIFFKQFAWLVMVGLYVIGIMLGIIVALISKKFIFKGEPVPFVMELPNYRLPGVKNVAQLLWEKVADFLKRAFTVILVATLIIWFLQTFNFRLDMVSDSKDSMLASIAGFISPVFKPLGFGDYRFVTALISGTLAKESVVSVLAVLFGSTQAIAEVLNSYSAFCLLIFCLLYTPCVAALSSIHRELGFKYSIGIAFFQLGIAYITSGLFSLIFHIIGVM